MRLDSRISEHRASGHLYQNTSRRSAIPPPRCEVNLNMFQSPDRRFGIPYRIGSIFKGTNQDFTPVKIPCPRSDTSYTTFTCFMSLPYDIRHMIWKLLIVPRNLDIWPTSFGFVSSGDHSSRVELTPRLWRLISSTPPPILLHISRDSREIALKYYVLSFGMELDCPSWYGSKIILPPRTYFNLKTDRVCLMTTHLDYTAMDMEPWFSVLRQNFNQPGMSLALHLPTVCKATLHDTQAFAQLFDKYKDIIFYVPVNPSHLKAPRNPAVITFDDWNRKQEKTTRVPVADVALRNIFKENAIHDLMKHYCGDDYSTEDSAAEKFVPKVKMSFRTLALA